MARVLYDYREEAGGVPTTLALEGLELEATALEIADYVVSERVAVERKAAADFVASLKDGRLFEQAERLASGYEVAVLIVEGSPRFATAAIEGAICGLIRRGLSVLRVDSSEETASVIARLARQEGRDSQPSRVKLARRQRDADEIAEDMLASLPGVSVVKARSLLEHFGTVQALAVADEKQLRQVDGIGAKTAELIRQTFTHRHGAHPWEE